MEVEPFSLPLRRPLGTARGEITEREGFLVRVGHAGETAVGEATPLPGWTESLTACREALESVDDPAAPLEALDGTPAARHAVESALLTCEARAADVSLGVYLADDEAVDAVPVNATVGDDDPPATARAARAAVENGFPAVKVKVGARPPSADRERLEAVRAACPDVELRADANGAWDRGTAREMLSAAVDLGFSYVEQPLPAADLAGHADLRGGGVDVALDESLTTHSVPEVLAAEAADRVVLKPMALGGPAAAREAALLADEQGVGTVVTTTIDGSYARTVAVHLAASLPEVVPCGLATASMLEADLQTPDPVPVVDGAIRLPSDGDPS
jgi:o-succinylbenzoate synthase